jgi:hypothetical protein
MPISIRVDDETGVAAIACSGVLRVEDAVESAAALWKSPGWAGRAAAWDFREARFDMSSSDIQGIARFILQNQPTPPPEKVAFVTARDAEFGMARMFEVYRKAPGTDFRVFRSYEDAISWLSV